MKLFDWLRAAGEVGSGSRIPVEPDFWRLWLVGLIMFIVRWTEMMAFGLYVYQLSGSPLTVATITMLRMVPMGLLGVFMGVAADRVDRRLGLIAIVLSLLTTSLSLALLAYTGYLAVWHLAVASLINGLAWTADMPVRRMLIGQAVEQSRFGTAIAVDTASNNGSRLIGPLIGGFMLGAAGVSGIFALSVVLYSIAAIAAFGLPRPDAKVRAIADGALAYLVDGLRLIRTNRRLRAALTITVLYNIFGFPCSSMIPVIGQDYLHLLPAGIGILAGMEGIGSITGALLIGVYARSQHYARLYVGGTFTYMAALILFALMSEPVLAGAALLLTGLMMAAFGVMQATLVYLAVPMEMRGRTLGLLSTCIGIAPLGFLHIGLLANWFGAQAAIIIVGGEGLLAALLTMPIWRALMTDNPAPAP